MLVVAIHSLRVFDGRMVHRSIVFSSVLKRLKRLGGTKDLRGRYVFEHTMYMNRISVFSRTFVARAGEASMRPGFCQHVGGTLVSNVSIE